ncbi:MULTISPECIES: AAA family ATPase [Deefgea]|uniref:AAA family ATPase n=1 Tax=Deefgea chitinilytica TaxID=570276 RepID=A0ABS2CAL2_9NEIS|nr:MULTISPECIES: AAA family ATPase [Deefgea]MBM5571092.1 AAA family ATPase [Deefgea chitinilytica]MBM9888322.1 AAA family ATPase [Deefgea sp. CFH1-16]
MTSSNPISSVPASPTNLLAMRIKHVRIAQVMSELETLIYPESQEGLLLVCGPTGVGKTALARYMCESALNAAASEMNANPGIIPAVYIEAIASGEEEFSWRMFYESILEQLDGNLDMPRAEFDVDEKSGRYYRARGANRNTIPALRKAVEKALQERKTQFLVIDEAVHIFMQSTSHTKLNKKISTLKSLANKCKTQLILLGSYDLYPLVNFSGQLTRRAHVLHFERYRQDNEEDLRAFRACVLKFQSALPELWGQDLMKYCDALHENTLGCIGTLRTVLIRAAKLAQKDGHWSEDALRRALLTEAQCMQILSEIVDGESAINPGLTRTMPKPVKSSGMHKAWKTV